jgi:hypothetical protein
LVRLHNALLASEFGSFLHNTERERRMASLPDTTRCVWRFMLARRSEWVNPAYVPPSPLQQQQPQQQQPLSAAALFSRSVSAASEPDVSSNAAAELPVTSSSSPQPQPLLLRPRSISESPACVPSMAGTCAPDAGEDDSWYDAGTDETQSGVSVAAENPATEASCGAPPVNGEQGSPNSSPNSPPNISPPLSALSALTDHMAAVCLGSADAPGSVLRPVCSQAVFTFWGGLYAPLLLTDQ